MQHEDPAIPHMFPCATCLHAYTAAPWPRMTHTCLHVSLITEDTTRDTFYAEAHMAVEPTIGTAHSHTMLSFALCLKRALLACRCCFACI